MLHKEPIVAILSSEAFNGYLGNGVTHGQLSLNESVLYSNSAINRKESGDGVNMLDPNELLSGI